jgi:Ran GTPase-activating protein (RanGAP) involved in mRNA processing and transport
LIQAIMIYDAVEELDLSYNYIEWSNFSILNKYMIETKVLKELNMANNNINDDAVFSIIDWLKQNRSIVDLNLKENNIFENGLEAIKTALMANKTLKVIWLSLYDLWVFWVKAIADLYDLNPFITVDYK